MITARHTSTDTSRRRQICTSHIPYLFLFFEGNVPTSKVIFILRSPSLLTRPHVHGRIIPTPNFSAKKKLPTSQLKKNSQLLIPILPLVHLNPSRNVPSTRSLSQIRPWNSHRPPFLSRSPICASALSLLCWCCCSTTVQGGDHAEPCGGGRRGRNYQGVWRCGRAQGNSEVRAIMCDYVFSLRFIFRCAVIQVVRRCGSDRRILGYPPDPHAECAQPSDYSHTSLPDLR
jgi:hypothetical protein